jgi:Tol biopolymer transport system component
MVWRDPQGKSLGNLGEASGRIMGLEFSPDGKTVAATRLINTTTDIWFYDVARATPSRFTFDPKDDRSAVWSPDGKTVYFSSNRKGTFEIYRKPADGSGTEEFLLSGDGTTYPSSVSPDGKLLLITKSGEKTGQDLWVLPVDPAGKSEPRLFLQTPFHEFDGQFSPDGHWVLYQSDESGRSEIYVASFPGPGGKRQISNAGGYAARWRKDGKEIFYVGDNQLLAAEVAVRGGTLDVGPAHKLFDGVNRSGLYGQIFGVTPDGQKFLMIERVGANEGRALTLVQNWTAVLRK